MFNQHYCGKEDAYTRIDFILLSPAMKRNWIAEETYIPVTPNWGVGSDHRPVVAGFATENLGKIYIQKSGLWCLLVMRKKPYAWITLALLGIFALLSVIPAVQPPKKHAQHIQSVNSIHSFSFTLTNGTSAGTMQ